MNKTITNPYVGPRPFTTKERELFFGRKREASNLSSLVIAERLVLFYAQSGAGKSSLINTSLIPDLEEEGFEVLPVGRVSGEIQSGVKVDNIFIYNLLLSLNQSSQKKDIGRFTTMTLADFLDNLIKDNDRYYYDKSVTPTEILPRTLIIDQFEEILTTHLEKWQKREDFFEQLAQALAVDPFLNIVLSMREDYVAALDPYAHLLPGKLRTRYYMQRMDDKAALEAVAEPAKKRERPFTKSAAKNLVNNLRQVRVHNPDGSQAWIVSQFVEPVQLQVHRT